MASLLDTLVGHNSLATRMNAMVKSDRLAPGYLLLGPSGVGKKKFALALAQTILCEKGPPACGTCPSCIRAEKGQHENLLFIEPDGTQIKIDQVRPVRDFVRLKMSGRARVVIINDAHTLNPQAGNALLKVLEEPPEKHHFFLITSQEAGVLPTLRSRCQALRFSPLSLEELKKIRPTTSWALTGAQGRVDRLEMLMDPELEEVRKAAIEAFRWALARDLFEVGGLTTKINQDKNSALFATQVWQILLRDTWFMKHALKPIINVDVMDLLQKSASLLSDESLDRLTEASLQMERDIHANVERNLIFENFWAQFAALVQPSAGVHH